MRYILASNNKHKLVEISAILQLNGDELISQREAGLDFEAEETGTTFEENAIIKAQAAAERLNMPAIADDSGIVVEALNGEPGVYSARYGGELCQNDEERTAYLLKNMEGKEDRRAKFVSCIACVFPNGDIITARGECHGVLNHAPVGENGFGYDPIFFMEEFGKTTAELAPSEKNAISHRGKALKIFEEKLRSYNANK